MKYGVPISIFFFFILSAPALMGQASQGQIPDAQTQIAISNPAYPVTAGDVYTLTYAAGGTPVTYLITVDYSYRIRVSNLGVINVAGKTYRQLKSEIETIVTNNYPLSGVQLVMTRPSVFKVSIKGEVNSAGELTTWAMGRLSSLLDGNLTVHSSKRNVTVTSSTGRTRTYDLFKANRLGDLSQDPFLRPDDVITIHRIDRVVSISGDVERPESYELLPGENLKDLITNYAGGYTHTADADAIEIVRYSESGREVNNKIHLKQDDVDANYPLQNLDAVYIPSK
jgi:protein involved in polysaccharide export with SLBB domain